MKALLGPALLVASLAIEATPAAAQELTPEAVQKKLVQLVETGMSPNELPALRAQVKEGSSAWTNVSLALYAMEEFSAAYPSASPAQLAELQGKLDTILMYLGMDRDKRKVAALRAAYLGHLGLTSEMQAGLSKQLSQVEGKLPAAEVAAFKELLAKGDLEAARGRLNAAFDRARFSEGSREAVAANTIGRILAPKPSAPIGELVKQYQAGLRIHDVPVPRSEPDARSYEAAAQTAGSARNWAIGGGVLAGVGAVGVVKGLAIASVPVWAPAALVGGGVLLVLAGGVWYFKRREKAAIEGQK